MPCKYRNLMVADLTRGQSRFSINDVNSAMARVMFSERELETALEDVYKEELTLVAFYQGFNLCSVLWRCIVDHFSSIHDVGHELHVLHLICFVGLETILLKDVFCAWKWVEKALIGFVETGRKGVGNILFSL